MLERLKRLPFVVKFLQIRHPSNSTCGICGLPWASCKSHDITIKQGYGFFPVCEWCWNNKSYIDNRQTIIDLFKKWRNECDGSYELPYTLSEMLYAFEIDWILTHNNIGDGTKE